MRRSTASLTAAIAVAAVSLSAFVACSEGSSDEDGTAGGGSTAVGRGGSGSGGKASRGGSGGTDTSGGAPAGEAGDGSGATSAGAPSSGKGGSGSGTGGEPSGGGGEPGAGGAIHVPGPAPGGGSVYAVECSGETEMCGTEYAHCLGLNLPDDQVGFACSNHCETVADCSDEPTGAEAQPGCVQFTMEKRCMLMCLQQGTEYSCPDGMSCYVYPNATFGYCLWL